MSDSMSDHDEGEQPGALDYYLAVQFPLLAMIGLLGEKPEKAWNALIPTFAVTFLIAFLIFLGFVAYGALVH